MPKPIPPLDLRTHQPMRFMVTVRREITPYANYCAGCGAKVPEHEGPWIYSMTSMDDVLCEACGDLYAPQVMREVRGYYEYIREQQARQAKDGASQG